MSRLWIELSKSKTKQTNQQVNKALGTGAGDWALVLLQEGHKPGMGTHTCKANTQEEDAGGSEVHGHSSIQSEFQVNLGHMPPWLKIYSGNYSLFFFFYPYTAVLISTSPLLPCPYSLLLDNLYAFLISVGSPMCADIHRGQKRTSAQLRRGWEEEREEETDVITS